MGTKAETRISKYVMLDPAVGLSIYLVRSNLSWVGRVLFKLLRIRWRHRSMRAEHGTTSEARPPTGPFEVRRPEHLGDLLLWVPRGIDSYLIDEVTGGYGYSHSTVDMGEIDVPTGKPVMAEITVGQTVTRKFQDQYGQRAFVRLSLAQAGVDAEEFVDCVKSKIGERYDGLDAITLGLIDDPAKEVCSGLVADCLPEEALREIAWAKRLGLLQRGSISIHSRLNAFKTKAFISPNGLAQFYGAPPGRKIRTRNTLIRPQQAEISMSNVARAAARRNVWRMAASAFMAMALVWVVRRSAGRA